MEILGKFPYTLIDWDIYEMYCIAFANYLKGLPVQNFNAWANIPE